MEKIIVYKNVYERKEPIEAEFIDFIQNPGEIYKAIGKSDYRIELNGIKNIEDKAERNIRKRDYLPAVDLSLSGILSIDSDNIAGNEVLKQEVIYRLKKLPATYVVKESVSGNVVAFFKYKCEVDKFKFLYYKLYLQLVLELSVNIDFLPEIGRLRYVSIGETYYVNENPAIINEMLVVDNLPYINTAVAKEKARSVSYGSR